MKVIYSGQTKKNQGAGILKAWIFKIRKEFYGSRISWENSGIGEF
jgi:hypothetical protein